MREQRQGSEWILSCQTSFKLKWDGSVLSPFCSVVVVDFVTKFALGEILYVDDLVLMSETIEGLMDKLLKWKEAFESKGLKVNLGKSKVMVVVWWCRPHPVCEHAQDLRPPLGARPASPPTRQAAQPPPRGPSTNPRPLV